MALADFGARVVSRIRCEIDLRFPYESKDVVVVAAAVV